jgi:hypothetical protein
LLRRSQFLILHPRLWGDGQEFSLSDGDGDIEGMVDNFEDDGWVLNGGGIAVLRTRVVSSGGIFDGGGGDISGSGCKGNLTVLRR